MLRDRVEPPCLLCGPGAPGTPRPRCSNRVEGRGEERETRRALFYRWAPWGTLWLFTGVGGVFRRSAPAWLGLHPCQALGILPGLQDSRGRPECGCHRPQRSVRMGVMQVYLHCGARRRDAEG